jgi:hypothetical protein
MNRRINILLLVAVAALSLWCTGDLMRKCDQAAILAGANDLAHGRMHPPSMYYQFDKTYVLYGVCASLIRLAPHNADPVALTNVGLAVLFWLSMAAFVFHFGKNISPVVLLCVLLSPAVLFNTQYVNSTVLSSAFLLLGALFVFRPGRLAEWAAALLFFLSVGSRADAILLLPLLLWLITPFPMLGNFFADCSRGWKKGLARLGGFSRHWKLAAAGVLALIAGRLLSGGGGVALDPIFNWKMVAGYTAFGFGAAGLLWAVQSCGLLWRALRADGALEKLYGAAGVAAFLLPVVFFLPQLHAPRYFFRGCEALLLVAVSGRALFVMNRRFAALLCCAALLPMIAGLRLPALNRPQLTLGSPMLFPSGDGFYPMGGYASFLRTLSRADAEPVDHNQLVWRAVHSADFEFSADGSIAVLRTPMYGYFLLEASLRGATARCLPLSRLGGAPFYVDSRSLMRDDPKDPLSELNRILSMPSRFVSPEYGGVGVLQVGAGDLLWAQKTLLLNRLFAGNEYRIADPDRAAVSLHRKVSFSEETFEHARLDPVSGLYYSENSHPAQQGIACAVAVFPAWMSMQAFSER